MESTLSYNKHKETQYSNYLYKNIPIKNIWMSERRITITTNLTLELIEKLHNLKPTSIEFFLIFK